MFVGNDEILVRIAVVDSLINGNMYMDEKVVYARECNRFEIDGKVEQCSVHILADTNRSDRPLDVSTKLNNDREQLN